LPKTVSLSSYSKSYSLILFMIMCYSTLQIFRANPQFSSQSFINNCAQFDLAQRYHEQLRHVVLWWSIQGATIDKIYSVSM